MLPVRQLHIPAQNVAVPAFSRLQGDPERFARYYLRTVNLMMWVSALIFGFLFVAEAPVIVLVLGSKWSEAAPVFQILAIAGLGQQLRQSVIWPLVSRGDSRRLLALSLIMAPVMIASYAFGIFFGLKGVALSGALALLGILPWMLKIAFKGTRLTLRGVGRASLFPVLISLVGVALGEVALHVFAPHRILYQLLVAALAFALAYSLSSLVPPVRKEIKSFRELIIGLRLSRQLI